MSAFIIRYFFILYCSIFAYYKLLNLRPLYRYHGLFTILFSMLTALMLSFSGELLLPFRSMLLYFIYLLFIVPYSRTKFTVSLVAATISHAGSYIALSISGLLLSAFGVLFSPDPSILLSPVSVLAGGLIQYALLYFVFQVKRLKQGMPFLFQNKPLNTGIVICSFIIVLNPLLTTLSPTYFPLNIITMLCIPLLAFALMYWWRYKIMRSYIEKLRLEELNELYQKIADQKNEITKINNSNHYLAKIIHKDNKLIPAMELAVRNYIQNAPTMNANEAKEYGSELLFQLQSLSSERKGIMEDHPKGSNIPPQIGICSIDAIILYMEKRATALGICYEIKYENHLKNHMPDYTIENDLLHLLSDLIENAIIATTNAESKKIFIHMGLFHDCLFMDISDSGSPFAAPTYQAFGLCPYTTHKDTGGSGIGLMDIWKLKRKYKASLQIYEYSPGTAAYTKKIRILFDKQNHYMVQTYRPAEILSMVTRNDLHVFPYSQTHTTKIHEEEKSSY